MRIFTILVAVMVLLLAGACEGDGPAPSDDPTDAPTATTTALGGPDVTATFGSGASTAEGSGEPVNVTDVDVAAFDDHDRVVFAIGGEGTAGWLVEYVDEARQQGSGLPVELAGDAALHVFIRHTGYPRDTGIDAYGTTEPIGGAEVIQEVVYTTIYEGDTEFFAGLDERRPFRVLRLEDPDRVVVQVRHSDGA